MQHTRNRLAGGPAQWWGWTFSVKVGLVVNGAHNSSRAHNPDEAGVARRTSEYGFAWKAGTAQRRNSILSSSIAFCVCLRIRLYWPGKQPGSHTRTQLREDECRARPNGRDDVLLPCHACHKQCATSRAVVGGALCGPLSRQRSNDSSLACTVVACSVSRTKATSPNESPWGQRDHHKRCNRGVGSGELLGQKTLPMAWRAATTASKALKKKAPSAGLQVRGRRCVRRCPG